MNDSRVATLLSNLSLDYCASPCTYLTDSELKYKESALAGKRANSLDFLKKALS